VQIRPRKKEKKKTPQEKMGAKDVLIQLYAFCLWGVLLKKEGGHDARKLWWKRRVSSTRPGAIGGTANA